MMVGLFVLFLIVQFFIFFEKWTHAVVLAVITLALSLALFIHHITVALPLRL